MSTPYNPWLVTRRPRVYFSDIALIAGFLFLLGWLGYYLHATSLREALRFDARQAVLDIALQMETLNKDTPGRYITLPDTLVTYSASRAYRLEIIPEVDTYTIFAYALGDQQADKECSVFLYRSDSTFRALNSLRVDNTKTCWESAL